MKLLVNSADHAAAYQAAQPFPHAVIDGAFDPAYLGEVSRSFPAATDPHWAFHQEVDQVKRSTHSDETLAPRMRELLFWLQSSTFIRFLEGVTGIRGLLPDPHFDGAGPHLITEGGHLNLHTDYNFARHLGLDRRVNALLYLTEDWKPYHGGELELWSWKQEGRRVQPERLVQKIPPLFGRLVVFGTTDFTFHGHPDPYQGPARRSIAMYYFTNGRPAGETRIPRGGQQTLFIPRPESKDGDQQRLQRWVLARPRLYALARAFRDVLKEGL